MLSTHPFIGAVQKHKDIQVDKVNPITVQSLKHEKYLNSNARRIAFTVQIFPSFQIVMWNPYLGVILKLTIVRRLVLEALKTKIAQSY